MYVRLNRMVSNPGWLVPRDEVHKFKEKQIKKKPADATKDWYISPFFYEEEAWDYYKTQIKDKNGKVTKPKNSMSGYNGSAWVDHLYWDIDCKDDFELARINASRIIDTFLDLDLEKGASLYFSGNKGFHIFLDIDTEIEQELLIKLVRHIASISKVDPKVFDTSVYNITRLLRLPNTKHQSSELYKIPLDLEEIYDLSGEEIRELAETTRPLKDINPPPPTKPVNIDSMIEEVESKKEEEIVVQESDREVDEIFEEVGDLLKNSSSRRRCIQLLEEGEFGPGERNDAIVRMAAYYKHEGVSEDEAFELINEALEKRASKYDVNAHDDKETWATLKHVYSDKWTGGIFSCKSDELLIKTCSNGGDCCAQPKNKVLGKTVLSIDQLCKNYIEYGNEAVEDFPTLGLKSLDEIVRIRPRNYSIIAGANGCVDADTEFMSRTGWKKISEWNGEEVLQFHPDTGKANFCDPIEYIKLPCEEFYHLETKYGIDQMLSSEHKVLYYSKNNTPQTASMEEVYNRHYSSTYGFRGKFKLSFDINDETTKLDMPDEQIRVMVAVIADGTFNSDTNKCTIRLKKESKKRRLETILEKAGIDFDRKKCEGAIEGFHRYTFQTPRKEKAYGEYWYRANNDQLRIIADEVLRWDGYKNQFSTCVKESADFVQYVFSATGKRASIYTLDRVGETRGAYTRKSIEYSVVVSSSEFTSIAGNAKERGVLPINKVKSRDGYKYCFTVPSGHLVLRRNDKVFTTGNSGKTSVIIQIMEKLNDEKIPHIIFSLDMADSSLFEKLAAKFTQYGVREVEEIFSAKSRDVERMREIMKVLTKEMPYTYFDFTSTTDMTHIKNTIKGLNEDIDKPVKMAFVDYTGRLAGDNESQYANSTSNALMTNDVAKETNTHIMLISQVAREHGDHTTPIRTSRAAKDSGSWEENATFVVTVWRPFGDGLAGIDKYMCMYVGKNRSGNQGELYFKWDGSTGRIDELDVSEFDTYKTMCEEYDKEPPSENTWHNFVGQNPDNPRLRSYEDEKDDGDEVTEERKSSRKAGRRNRANKDKSNKKDAREAFKDELRRKREEENEE